MSLQTVCSLVKSENQHWKITKLKLTLIYLSSVSVVEFNEMFGEQPPRQLFLPEVLLVNLYGL